MTESDYAKLDEILMDNIELGLSIDEAHGFLTAMLVSQIELSKTECFESICSTIEISSPDRETLISLIYDMYTVIQQMLNSQSGFDILVIETEEQGDIVEVHEGWCHGFMLAVSQEQKTWDLLGKNEQSILSPIAKIALLISDESLEIEDDEYDMLVDLLPGSVLSLNSFFANQQQK